MSAEDGSGGRPQHWWQGASSMVQTVATKSVVTSVQWVCGIVAFVAIAAMIWGSDGIEVAAFSLFAVSVVLFFVAYGVWMKLAPSRLQSEKHLTDMRRLDLQQVIGDERHKDDPKVINAEPVQNSHPQIPADIAKIDSALMEESK